MFEYNESTISYDPLYISAITVAETLALTMLQTGTDAQAIADAYVAVFSSIMDDCAAKGEKK